MLDDKWKEWEGEPGEKGDPLERVYTPDAFALAVAGLIVFDIDNGYRTGWPSLVIDAGVGGGALTRAFQRLSPSSTFIGVDVDPRLNDSTGNVLPSGDGVTLIVRRPWLDFCRRGLPGGYAPEETLVISNPPFKQAPSWIDATVTHLGCSSAWILPADVAVRGPRSGWPDVWSKHAATLHVANGRPWPRTSREVGLFWIPRREGGVTVATTRFGWRGEL